MQMCLKGMGLSVLGLAVLISGCGYEERSYRSLSDVRDEGDLSMVSALSMPKDAVSITFISDVESGLYFASYETQSPVDQIKMAGMSASAAAQIGPIRDSAGFGVDLPSDVEVFYKCIDLPEHQAGATEGPGEIALAGISSKRIYQWNQRHNDRLEGRLCRRIKK
ncbi:hypothetical protein [Stenotrophomonas sp.]|uniref:hypothetical protein n=1 Tax=Stenotrophomonas sp. TaxID=69392 RepID=UPI0028AB8976|nr:hypothetical protein [Stenotrophomonas sp.]